MQKLIAIVGASGVGKTTLVQALAQTGKFATAYEQHRQRPCQALFKQDPHYALANQLDYLLLRAEQEKELRTSACIGLMDGGLDLDFHGFTRLFLRRGLLTQPEYDLCARLYTFIRTTLPAPELIINLKAYPETITRRLASRQRINIARAEDTEIFTTDLEAWLQSLPTQQVVTLDASDETTRYEKGVARILAAIHRLESTAN